MWHVSAAAKDENVEKVYDRFLPIFVRTGCGRGAVSKQKRRPKSYISLLIALDSPASNPDPADVLRPDWIRRRSRLKATCENDPLSLFPSPGGPLRSCLRRPPVSAPSSPFFVGGM